MQQQRLRTVPPRLSRSRFGWAFSIPTSRPPSGSNAPHELQHSALDDPRWFELFLWQLKEQEAFQEARRKLGQRRPGNPGDSRKDETEKPERPPKGAAKTKAKAAGSDKASSLPTSLNACSLLNSMPRRLLHLDSPLGSFARSIFRQADRMRSCTAMPASEVWPMPPPYPAARRETGEAAASRARKRAINSIVIALSFLHLRGPSEAPSAVVVGRRLNFRRWAVVRRYECLLEAWLIHPQITRGATQQKWKSLTPFLGSLRRSWSLLWSRRRRT